MRLVIALLFVAAVATSFVAYGPELSFSIGAAPEPEPEPVEAPEPEPEPLPDAAAVAPGEIVPGTDGLRRVSGVVERTVFHTLAAKLDRSVADPLTQVVSRALVWWVDLRRELQPGDALTAIYSLHDGEEPRVHAVSFTSRRHGRTFRAYAFQPEGSPFRRLYTEDGVEVERRLVDSPIRDYEQITSLLWDGRGHQGVDFKAPVGTKVYAPFDGVVSRRNWNTRFNGNCLQIRTSDGRDMLFLHLDRIPDEIQAGRRVSKGDVIALSGNTGRSTAPHLHYQLQTAAGRVLDPFDVHETRRKSLPESERTRFAEVVAQMRVLLDPPEDPEAVAEAD
jgi:murein DD-endopeptidase